MHPPSPSLPAASLPGRLPVRAARRRLPLPAVLLCDLDGTLVDTMPGFADCAAEVIEASHGVDRAMARASYLATSGRPFCDQIDLLWPDDPRNPAAIRRFERHKLEVSARSRMSPGTRSALAWLRARGVRIAGSSNNSQENVDDFVRASGFPFDLALGFGGGIRKGAPHVTAVARAFGRAGRDILFVGDSLHDGDLAAASGIGFVGVAGTFPRERFTRRFPGRPVVDSVAELPALFG